MTEGKKRGRKKKEPTKESNDENPFEKVTYRQVQAAMCQVLDETYSVNIGSSPQGGCFKRDFRVYAKPNEQPQLYEIKRDFIEGVADAAPVDLPTIAGALFHYSGWYETVCPKAALTYAQSEQVVKAWIASTKIKRLSEMPKPVAFKTQNVLCLSGNRLGFDPVMTDFDLAEKAPTFVSILERITTNKNAFVYRIGSLFDDIADRKQAVWIHGKRDAGKSMLEHFIRSLVGYESSMSVSDDEMDDKHWKEPLVGKRAVFFQEAATGFIQSSKFKALTGDLYHSINPKGFKRFMAPLPVMLFFFSNKAPAISSDDSLLVRIIDCEIEAVSEEDRRPIAEIERLIEQEKPYIVGHCIKEYQANVPKGGRIPLDNSKLIELSENHEGEWLEWLHTRFEIDPDFFVLGRHVLEEMLDAKMGNQVKGKLARVAERTCNVERMTKWCASPNRFLRPKNGFKPPASKMVIWSGVKWRSPYSNRYCSIAWRDYEAGEYRNSEGAQEGPGDGSVDFEMGAIS